MKKKLLQNTLIVSISVIAIVLISWKEYKPEQLCEDKTRRNGKISVHFNAGPNSFRKTNYEYYVPSPDMRFNNVPGQNSFDQTKFICLVSITSPNCSGFQFSKSFINPGNILDVELPAVGYDAVVKVTYYERGEDNTTVDFNKPAFDVFGSPKQYSRVHYSAQRTFMGGFSGSVAQPIYLSPSHHEGYNVDPLNGRIQYEGTKVDIGDISGINAYIDLGL
jgi:hypothetical protein